MPGVWTTRLRARGLPPTTPPTTSPCALGPGDNMAPPCHSPRLVWLISSRPVSFERAPTSSGRASPHDVHCPALACRQRPRASLLSTSSSGARTPPWPWPSRVARHSSCPRRFGSTGSPTARASLTPSATSCRRAKACPDQAQRSANPFAPLLAPSPPASAPNRLPSCPSAPSLHRCTSSGSGLARPS